MTNNVMTDDRAQIAAAKADRLIEPCALVLFGASGDLTQRMIAPAIFSPRAKSGLLPPEFRLIGYGRTEMTDDEFPARMRTAVMRDATAATRRRGLGFAARLSYIPAEYDGDDLQGYAELGRRFEELDRARRGRATALLPRHSALPVCADHEHLGEAKLAGLAYRSGRRGLGALRHRKTLRA